ELPIPQPQLTFAGVATARPGTAATQRTATQGAATQRAATRPRSARDQALALDLALGLLRGDVGGRQNDVRAEQLVVGHEPSMRADVVQQAAEYLPEGLLVA